MDAVSRFIADARAKGLHDEQIKQLLKGNGWTEEQAQQVLLDLAIPAVPTKAKGHPVRSKPNGVSIGALEAALHHTLLWIFSLASSIMISTVSYTLLGGVDASSGTLWAYIVVELMTFIPFAVLFGHYLVKLRSRSDLKTGKVWSIITIVLHSVAFMAAITTFILALILAHGDTKKAMVVASLALACMFALVISAYVVANFIKVAHKRKKEILTAFPILLFAIIAFMAVGAIRQIHPLRADEKTRERLVEVTEAVRKETAIRNALPNSIQAFDINTEGIEYAKQNDSTYKLCATFHKNRSSDYGSGDIIQDGYVAIYDFEDVKHGKQCFTVESSKLTEETYYDGQ